MEGDALSTLIVNRLCGTLNVVCVKAPASATAAREMLQDIAIPHRRHCHLLRCGSGAEGGHSDPAGSGPSGEGHQKENTTIVNGAGSSEEIKARVDQIKSQIEVQHLRL